MPFKYINEMRRNRASRKTKPATDLTRWRLSNVEGRQTWQYFEKEEDISRPQTMIEKHAIGLDTSNEAPPLPKAEKAQDVAYNGMTFYAKLQREDGHWSGDYYGPQIVMPGLVILYYIIKIPFAEAQRLEMIRYLRSIMCPDGGWGIHVAGPPTVLGTTLNYCAMRLLGVLAADPDLVNSRSLLHKLGGAVAIPSWGKFWLSVLNVYSWDGVNSLFPEIWLLPTWLPFHPSKFWCHNRQTYQPMAYCFGRRIVTPEDDLIRELRKELYVEDFYQINWPQQRNNVSSADLYTPHSWLLDLSLRVLNIYEKFHVGFIRKKTLSVLYEHIVAGDRFTKCISIDANCKILTMLARYYEEGPLSRDFKLHQSRVQDYLWIGVDGLKMTGTNGSQLWDTAFALHAYIEAGACNKEEFGPCLRAAHEFICLTQIRENLPDYKKYYRQMSKGAFPFSTRDHGWILSDCTAEAIRAVIRLQNKFPIQKPIPKEMLFCGIDVLLSLRNDDNGWATYEKTRGWKMLELLNASEVYGNTVIDCSYVECTSSCIQGLAVFTNMYPEYRQSEIKIALHEGLKFIQNKQRPDGSWEGSWGVCFTYGTWFALEAYGCMGYTYSSGKDLPLAVKRGCEFLLSKQMDDGGWGENFESCELREYVNSETSQIINTCWAILGLLAVNYPDLEVLERGIMTIMSRQLPNGDWPEEDACGAHNMSGAFNYTSYRSIFPIWTLGRFVHMHPESSLVKA